MSKVAIEPNGSTPTPVVTTVDEYDLDKWEAIHTGTVRHPSLGDRDTVQFVKFPGEAWKVSIQADPEDYSPEDVAAFVGAVQLAAREAAARNAVDQPVPGDITTAQGIERYAAETGQDFLALLGQAVAESAGRLRLPRFVLAPEDGVL